MSPWVRQDPIKSIEFSPVISPRSPLPVITESEEDMSTASEPPPECQLTKNEGNVRIRLATLNDLPAVADTAALAMLDDAVFRFVCPNLDKFYDHYRDGLLRRIKQKLCTPGWIVCVAVYLDLSDVEIREKAIMGYAAWERIGDNEHAKKWQRFGGGFWNGLERSLLKMTDTYYDLFSLDKSLDKQRLHEYRLASADCFPFDNYPDLWYLGNLAVHPACQRRGVGRALVSWGMSHAAAEDAIVGVEASLKGAGLWASLGFVTVRQVPGFDHEILHAMVWEMDMIL